MGAENECRSSMSTKVSGERMNGVTPHESCHGIGSVPLVVVARGVMMKRRKKRCVCLCVLRTRHRR